MNGTSVLSAAPVLGPVLAVVLALAVACSESATTPSSTPPPSEDAGADATADAGVDAQRVKGCPGETPVAYAWQPPAARQASACSEADLTALGRVIAQSAVVLHSDITGALGPSCAACAVGHVSDVTWRAVVAGHDGYIGNVGGCAIHLGANEACGKAVDRLSTCLIAGCEGCADRKAQDVCADRLTTVDGACASALTTMRKQCPAAILAAAFDTSGACQSFVETIRLFCGPRALDGG